MSQNSPNTMKSNGSAALYALYMYVSSIQAPCLLASSPIMQTLILPVVSYLSGRGVHSQSLISSAIIKRKPWKKNSLPRPITMAPNWVL